MAYRACPIELVVHLAGLVLRRVGPVVCLYLLKSVIQVVTAGGSGAELQAPLIVLVVTLTITEVGTAFAKNFDTRIEEKLAPYIHTLILDKAASLPAAAFEDPNTHNLIERANRNSKTVHELMGDIFFTAAIFVQAFSTLLLLATTSLSIAGLALVAAIPIAWTGTRQGKRMHGLEKEHSPSRRLTDYLGRLLSGRESATELRGFQLRQFFLERWRQAFTLRKAEFLRGRFLGTREGWLACLAANTLFGLALLLIVDRAFRGLISTGEIIVLISAVRILQTALTQAAGSLGFIWQYGLPVADLRHFLEMPVDNEESPGTHSFPDKLMHTIRFEDVHFTYPGAAEPVLKGLSLELRAGEKIALVGVNGAGKSTLIKLLLCFYRPTSGRITVDGVDLQEINPASLRDNLSCVFQDFLRYELTLFDNVALGRVGAGHPVVESVCQATGLSDLVNSLPTGYDTQLGKAFSGGVGLSGGQWQRIALARAFARDAQVLILDEPTAALDPLAELEVFGRFIELVLDKTAIIISHRLGSARLADRVVVLSDGRLAETGSHHELMAKNGIYAELFRMQAQWYEDADVAAAKEGLL